MKVCLVFGHLHVSFSVILTVSVPGPAVPEEASCGSTCGVALSSCCTFVLCDKHTCISQLPLCGTLGSFMVNFSPDYRLQAGKEKQLRVYGWGGGQGVSLRQSSGAVVGWKEETRGRVLKCSRW